MVKVWVKDKVWLRFGQAYGYVKDMVLLRCRVGHGKGSIEIKVMSRIRFG